MKEFAKSFYKSKAWQHTREAYAASVGWLCEDCLKRGMHTPGVIVHHIEPLTPENINDPLIALDWKNLRLVCRGCHGCEHSKKRYKADEYGRRYKVDEYGRIII